MKIDNNLDELLLDVAKEKNVLKIYNPLNHFIRAYSHLEFKYPMHISISSIRDTILALQSLYQKLNLNRHSLGGLRIEMRIFFKSFDEALEYFMSFGFISPSSIAEWMNQYFYKEDDGCIHYERIEIDRYLCNIRDMFVIIESMKKWKRDEEQTINFMIRNSKKIGDEERKMIIDLYNAFGIYKSNFKHLKNKKDLTISYWMQKTSCDKIILKKLCDEDKIKYHAFTILKLKHHRDSYDDNLFKIIDNLEENKDEIICVKEDLIENLYIQKNNNSRRKMSAIKKGRRRNFQCDLKAFINIEDIADDLIEYMQRNGLNLSGWREYFYEKKEMKVAREKQIKKSRMKK